MSSFLLNPYISFGGAVPEGVGSAQVLVTADADGEFEASDPFFANVLLLMNFETALTTNDAPSGFTINSNGLLARTTLGTGKFGEGVHQPAGNAGTHTFNGVNTDNWDMGTSNFTIEAWVYRENAVSATFMSHWRNASTQQAWRLSLDASGFLTVAFNAPASTPFSITDTSAALPNNAWSHIVFERSGTTFRLYKDGVMVGTKITGVSAALAAVTNAADDFLRIGSLSGAQIFFDDDFPQRRMDEIRITRGTARYDSDSGYTVPTGPFPTS